MASSTKLKAIATLAQVSISTASRVMTNKGYVSPEARERVLNALAELTDKDTSLEDKFQRFPLNVGIVLSKEEFIDDDPTTSVDITTLRNTIEKRGNRVFLLQCHDKAAKDSLDLAIALRKVDIAIVNDPKVDDGAFLDLERCKLPYLVTNGYDPSKNRFFVDYDNYQGAFDATSHLLGLGHRNIGFITGIPDRLVSENRLRACRAAVQGYGLAWQENRVESGYFKLNGGYQACTRLFRTSPDLTAIFAFNDLSAIGAIRAIREMGKAIPEEVSVVGFDDMEIAGYADPPLTTVSRFSKVYNSLMAQAIEDLAKEPSIGYIGTLLKTQLIVRSSTASP